MFVLFYRWINYLRLFFFEKWEVILNILLDGIYESKRNLDIFIFG